MATQTDQPGDLHDSRHAGDCEHKQTEVRLYTASNGVQHIRRQCLRCGVSIETIKKLNLTRDLSTLPAWDAELRERFMQQQWEIQKQAREVQRTREQEEFNDWYATYLTTDRWRRIRERVLARANGRCEGCGQRSATQVHHLNYKHVGAEFLFELVAVCRDCHERLHEIEGQS